MRIAMLLLLALPLAAQTVEERLQKLEQEVADLKRENEQLRRDLGVEVMARQTTTKIAGHESSLQTGGMLQVQADAGDKGDARFSSANERFFLRRARINLSGKFVEDFDFRTEVELAGSLAEATGLRAQLTDAYVTWTRFDLASVRAGQMKTPFGFEQLYPDPQLYTIERSLVNDRLTPGRQLGVQVLGRSNDEHLSYAAGVFNGNGTNLSLNDNDRFMRAGRVAYAPLPDRWSIGANAFRSRDTNLATSSEFGFANNLFSGTRTAVAADTQLHLGRFEFWSEALRADFTPIRGNRFRGSGGYNQASFFVLPDALQVVAKYETFLRTKTSVAGLNYYIKQHDLKLQLDWLHSKVPGAAATQQKWIARLQTVF